MHRGVAFDLDGTLTDPQVGITRCLAHGLAAVGMPVDDPATLLSDAASFKIIGQRVQRPDIPLKVNGSAKFGIDGATLTARFPRLIYADLGAFGHTGPWQKRPGYEPIIQAVAGLVSLNGDPSGPAARIGVSIIDLSTGMWTAIGILAALAKRAKEHAGTPMIVSALVSAATIERPMPHHGVSLLPRK